MSRRPPWSTLGLDPGPDTSAIRKAYAERLKAMDVDKDVAGFAQLRNARDQALRLARQMAAQEADRDDAGEIVGEILGAIDDIGETAAGDEPEFVNPGEAEPPLRWTYAAPQLAGDWQAGPELSARLEGGNEPEGSTLLARMAWAAAAARDSEQGGVSGAGIPLTTIDPFTAPLLAGNFTGDEALGLRPGETPAERLAQLLDPEAENAGAPLTESEVRAATRALGAILDEAAQSHVTRQQQIEDWLAEILARGWPRSAPLLEDANGAFGWEREWGAHDARPAVEFLGARLRGYRFQLKVADPGHRFHKAWNELVRPGRAGMLRVIGGPSQSDVDALLRGVRKHFPELEAHFDDERVASWEAGNGMLTGALVAIGVLAFVVLVMVLDSANPTKPSSLAPPVEVVASEPSNEQQAEDMRPVLDHVVTETFGTGHDMAWLWNKQPDLAQVIAANTRNALKAGVGAEITDRPEDVAARKAVEVVRERSYLVGRELEGKDFETTMQLRLGQLRAARKASDAACMLLMRSAWIDAATPFPEALRAKERMFAAKLADEGKLGTPRRTDTPLTMIPGVLIGKVVKSTGLGEETIGAALQGKGTDHDRCAVTIALLEATLDWSGKNRRAILRLQ